MHSGGYGRPQAPNNRNQPERKERMVYITSLSIYNYIYIYNTYGRLYGFSNFYCLGVAMKYANIQSAGTKCKFDLD